jgi:hypothetical protein
MKKSESFKPDKNFYYSHEWRQLRFKILAHYGKECMACGSKEGPAHVDHIYPVSLFPDKILDFDNLQVLCEECNIGKSNKIIADFRKGAQTRVIKAIKEKKRRAKGVSEAKPLDVTIIKGKVGLLIVSRKRKSHLWNRFDTFCNSYENGSIYFNSKTFFKSHDEKFEDDDRENICKICLEMLKKAPDTAIINTLRSNI